MFYEYQSSISGFFEYEVFVKKLEIEIIWATQTK